MGVGWDPTGPVCVCGRIHSRHFKSTSYQEYYRDAYIRELRIVISLPADYLLPRPFSIKLVYHNGDCRFRAEVVGFMETSNIRPAETLRRYLRSSDA